MLFTSKKIGDTQIPNRFVHSATYEVMAKENGEVSDELIKRYGRLRDGSIRNRAREFVCNSRIVLSSSSFPL